MPRVNVEVHFVLTIDAMHCRDIDIDIDFDYPQNGIIKCVATVIERENSKYVRVPVDQINLRDHEHHLPHEVPFESSHREHEMCAATFDWLVLISPGSCMLHHIPNALKLLFL
jgi:hypothetical protein